MYLWLEQLLSNTASIERSVLETLTRITTLVTPDLVVNLFNSRKCLILCTYADARKFVKAGFH